MAVDVSTFITEYPEFSTANTAQPALVARAFRVAVATVSPITFGDLYQDAVFAFTAHTLAQSPYGEQLRLADGGDRYKVLYDQMAATRPIRVAVSGGLLSGF